ncbi:N-acetyltransferase [Micromonospora sp. NPDC048930]|uniref:N-acetyltransferase n=1 Tax=Micromonospora sp. NPDC048930 TaxID=3364261 RepID=UPI003722DD40
MKLIDTTVRRATGEDLAALSTVVADALMAHAVGAWLVPDAAERPEVLYRYADLVVTHGLEYGQVDTTDDYAAVAVWYAQLEPPPPAAGWVFDLHRLLGRHAARFALLHAYVDAVHPHTPHHYLAQIAARSGQDAAANALLTDHHRLLDADGLPSCAEVDSDRPRDSLLARLGYQQRSPVLLEPGGPVLWRMWRPPPGGDQPGGLPRRVRLSRSATPFRGRVMPAASPRSP